MSADKPSRPNMYDTVPNEAALKAGVATEGELDPTSKAMNNLLDSVALSSRPLMKFTPDYQEANIVEGYYPGRFEYILGKVVTGLCTGASVKDYRTMPRRAIEATEAIIKALDERDKAQG